MRDRIREDQSIARGSTYFAITLPPIPAPTMIKSYDLPATVLRSVIKMACADATSQAEARVAKENMKEREGQK